MTSSMLEFVDESDQSELQELARVVRKFANERFGSRPSHMRLFQRADFLAMGDLGLAGITVSESAGGSGLSPLSAAVVMFELARAELGPAIYLSVHQMVARLVEKFATGNPGQNFLPQLAAGKILGAFCLTEAEAGSDAANVQTRATLAGDGYLLDGEKIYITSAGVADLYIVFARSGEAKQAGISAFMVPADTPGLEFGTAEKKMGCESSPIASIRLNNCKVSAENMLGNAGEGYRIALWGLNGGRINIAAAACGLSSTALKIAGEHLLSRKQFDHPLADFQGLQFMYADMWSAFAASRLLTRAAAESLVKKPQENAAAATAKCFATDSAMRITTDAVQCLGGAGYLADYAVERLMREAKMLQIVEGTNQIQRMIIARELFASFDG